MKNNLVNSQSFVNLYKTIKPQILEEMVEGGKGWFE